MCIRDRNTIENSFEFVKIKGEISKPSFPSSGHIYFSLKDETSLINATIWKWSLANIGLMPEEGLEVICSGKLTTYPGRSSYQINISKIEHAGEGALLKQLEERKKKFFSEGYLIFLSLVLFLCKIFLTARCAWCQKFI